MSACSSYPLFFIVNFDVTSNVLSMSFELTLISLLGGRPPKKMLAAVPSAPPPPPPPPLPPTVLSQADEALLSNAINNATQRLNLKQSMGSQPSSLPSHKARPSMSPHPLSQSHVLAHPSSLGDHGVPPPPKMMIKRKKKKSESHEQRSRHSSQASSSSDSEEEMVAQDEYEEEEEKEINETDGVREATRGEDEDGGMDMDHPAGSQDGCGRTHSAIQDDPRILAATPTPSAQPLSSTSLVKLESTTTSQARQQYFFFFGLPNPRSRCKVVSLSLSWVLVLS